MKKLRKAKISEERHFEVAFQRPDGKHQLDLLLRVDSPAGERFLAVEMLRQGYPRDIRNAIWQLEEYRLSVKDALRPIPIVVAEFLSAGAREILRERNIGFFDASGSLFLRHKHWLINIDRPAKPARPRRAAALFTGAREQVVHALLQSHHRWLTGIEIASLAETSPYTVSLTMQELERLEMVESEGSGKNLRRRLTQPSELFFDAWIVAWSARKETKTRWYSYTPNPKTLLLTLTEKLRTGKKLADWSFTGPAAANVLAPLLTNVETAEVIVPPGKTHRYAEALGLERVDKGSNVTLIERTGASTLFFVDNTLSSPPGSLVRSSSIWTCRTAAAATRNLHLTFAQTS
ncbi:hypothetical protein ACFS07_35600 [Undibacterium arcticum]